MADMYEDQQDPILSLLSSAMSAAGEAPQGAFLGPQTGAEDQQGIPFNPGMLIEEPLFADVLAQLSPSQNPDVAATDMLAKVTNPQGFDAGQGLLSITPTSPYDPHTPAGDMPTAKNVKVIQPGEEKPIGQPFRYADEAEGTFHIKSAQPQLTTGTVSTPETRLFGDNFAARMQAIKDAQDPHVKMELFNQLQVDAAGEMSKTMEQMRDQAKIKLGIPNLQQQLAASQALDRQASPMGTYVMSQQTKMLSSQLDHANAMIDHEANAMIKSNVRINTIKAQVEGLGKVIDYDMKRADRKADKLETLDLQDQYEQKRHDRNQREKQEAQTEAIMLSTTAEQRQRLGYLFPSLVQPDGTINDAEAGNLIKKGKLDQDILKTIRTPPDELISRAAGGDPIAKAMVIGEEAGRTGKSVEEVSKTVNLMQSLADDRSKIKAVASAVYGPGSEQYKTFQNLQNMVALGGAKKEELAQYKAMAGNLAYQHLSRIEQGNWIKDTSSWQVRDPVVLAAIQTAKSAGDASLPQIARTLAASAETPQDKIRVSQALRQEIFANAQGTRSMLANKDPDAAWAQAQNEFTKSRYATLMDSVGKTSDGIIKSMVAETPHAAAYDWLFGQRK